MSQNCTTVRNTREKRVQKNTDDVNSTASEINLERKRRLEKIDVKNVNKYR